MIEPLSSPRTRPSRHGIIVFTGEYHVCPETNWFSSLFQPDTAPLLKPTMKPVPSDALIGVPGATVCEVSTR